MSEIGFHTLLATEAPGRSFRPFSPRATASFDFEQFYEALSCAASRSIPANSPSGRASGSAPSARSMRVMLALVDAIREMMSEMGVSDMTPEDEEDERQAS